MTTVNDIEIEFEKHEETNDWKDFYEDIRFQDLTKSKSFSISNAKHTFNMKYNRYKDIMPYDHSRVKLKEATDTDYINANYVECKLANKKYICAQAPLKNTCEHFWQMIWEHNTKGIIMLNRLYEKGQCKCEMYYPSVDEDNSELCIEFGKFRLSYSSERPFEDFSIRTIECENIEQKEKRIVYHCHYSNWPDFGEPEYTHSFLNFLSECYKLDIYNSELYGPPVIHCSAGVGRTGTFILVDSFIQLFKLYGNELPLSISDLLLELRTFRMGLVQTHQQFKFAYSAIIDAIKTNRYSNDSAYSTEASSVGCSSKKNSIAKNSFSSDEDEEFDDDDDDEDSTNRPSTGKLVKRIKPAKENENHIKNLRQLQFQNKAIKEDGHNDGNNELMKDSKCPVDFDFAKTAVNRTKNKADESDDEGMDEEDDDDEPFATNRNISTVKVNEKRKPLQETLKLIEQEAKTPEIPIEKLKTDEVQSENSETTLSKRNISEKEKRISEMVSSMKQKQVKHEQKKKFYDDLKPLLIGGGIFLGGIIIHQLYKSFFLK